MGIFLVVVTLVGFFFLMMVVMLLRGDQPDAGGCINGIGTMEKIFHARWWDYSDRFLNLNGRVCVPASTLFGLFAMLVVRVLQPALEALFALIGTRSLSGFCGVFLAVFAADLLITNIGLKPLLAIPGAYTTDMISIWYRPFFLPRRAAVARPLRDTYWGQHPPYFQ